MHDPAAPKEERLKQLAALMTHPDNGRFTRTVVNRIWHRLMGRGIVHPVDAMDSRPWNEDLLDYLAVRFAEDEYDLRKFIRFVMTSQAYRSRTVILTAAPGDDYQYAGPIAKRMTAEQLMDSIWQITGTHPEEATAKVNRTIAAPKSESQPDTQLAEIPIGAHWIWHEGTVGKKSQLRKTFTLAEKPAAARLAITCDNAFVLKLNGKRVASSKDWQKPVYLDVADHLHVGENRIEVDAEMFGGAAGLIAQLQFVQAGKQQVLTTDTTWEARPPKGTWAAAKAVHPYASGPWGANLINPSLLVKASATSGITPPVRAALVKNDFLMRSLGRPHRDQVVSTRPAELTTLQAIDLSNGDVLAGYLQNGARNLTQNLPSDTMLSDWLYRYALSRVPTANEKKVLQSIAGDGSNPIHVEDLLWLVIMQPEFQVIR